MNFSLRMELNPQATKKKKKSMEIANYTTPYLLWFTSNKHVVQSCTLCLHINYTSCTQTQSFN